MKAWDQIPGFCFWETVKLLESRAMRTTALLISLLLAGSANSHSESKPDGGTHSGFAFCRKDTDKSIPVYLTECSGDASEGLKCGDKVEIVERHGSWLKVRLGGGTVRYIEATSISLGQDRYTPATDLPDNGAPECDFPDARSSGRKPPRAVYTPDPEYSISARKRKIQGIVVVSLTVDSAGQPRDLRVERKLDRELDEAAIEAVQQWRFEPATQDGRPVEVKVNVEVAFRLYK